MMKAGAKILTRSAGLLNRATGRRVDSAGQNAITRFGLIRHASTVWNQEKRIQGQQDSPLTDDGVALARQWGRLLQAHHWDLILASDLGRAARTAFLVNETLRAPIEYDPGLREQDWGRWEGKTLARIREETPELLLQQMTAGWKFRPPGGESRDRLWKRSSRSLLAAAEGRPGKRVLVVTHEGVIKSLIYRLSGRKFLPTEPPVFEERKLHWLVYADGLLRIDRINAMALE